MRFGSEGYAPGATGQRARVGVAAVLPEYGMRLPQCGRAQADDMAQAIGRLAAVAARQGAEILYGAALPKEGAVQAWLEVQKPTTWPVALKSEAKQSGNPSSSPKSVTRPDRQSAA